MSRRQMKMLSLCSLLLFLNICISSKSLPFFFATLTLWEVATRHITNCCQLPDTKSTRGGQPEALLMSWQKQTDNFPLQREKRGCAVHSDLFSFFLFSFFWSDEPLQLVRVTRDTEACSRGCVKRKSHVLGSSGCCTCAWMEQRPHSVNGDKEWLSSLVHSH